MSGCGRTLTCAAFLATTLVWMYWHRKSKADNSDLLLLSENENECQSSAEDSSEQKTPLMRMPGDAVLWNGGNLICCVSHWKERCYINGTFWCVRILNSRRRYFQVRIRFFVSFNMKSGILAWGRPKIRTAFLFWIWKSWGFHLNS